MSQTVVSREELFTMATEIAQAGNRKIAMDNELRRKKAESPANPPGDFANARPDAERQRTA
jgi:hypothetical protein